MIDEVDTNHGLPHTISRPTLYEDCIDLYKSTLATLITEYPFRIAYKNEKALDTGGVSRDLFSAFWELAYVKDFDGGSTYVPVVHPHTDMSHYRVLGAILSHGFMSCGLLPNRLAFPVIACSLLGCNVLIPDAIIVDSFIDYVSNYESAIFREALVISKKAGAQFTSQLEDSLLTILGNMGSREVPTPRNIQQMIKQVARHELVVKPLGALMELHSGVPRAYTPFLHSYTVEEMYELYKALNATPGSVLRMIEHPDDMNASQSRILGYLKTMIGNINHQDLRKFCDR